MCRNIVSPVRVKYLLLISVFFFIATVSYAQSLSGKISDKEGKGISNIEVSILKRDSTLVKSLVTDNTGTFLFSLSANDYILQAKEFKNVLYNKNISVSNADISLGNINIVSVKNIQEVTIKRRKAVLERKVDRMVFNAENSAASQGMSTLDALINTPLVRVQNDNISIVGKSGVSIMINDKIVNLSGVELTNYIQSLRSDNVAKIEVITTPPAKYEAQGNSGIINIVLKKNPDLGWSGSLSTGYVRRSEDGFSNNLNLNYQNRKISSSLKLRQYDNKKRSSEVNSIEAVSSLYSDDKRLDMNNGLGVNYGSEIQITDKSRAGIVYDFADLNQNMDIRNLSDYKTLSTRDSLLSTYAEHRQNAQTHMINLYYDYKIDSLGKKFSLNANYFSNNPKNEINFTTDNLTYNRSNSFRSYNYTKYNVWSAQGDFVLPLKPAAFETGIKFSKFDNRSDLRYYKIDTFPVIMPGGANLFNYTEENYAIYLSAEKILSDRWTSKGGLRYEYSIITGESPIATTNEKYNYGQFFPTAYLAYKHNANNMFTLNYSRRINRPFFRALNPNRWYTNPYTFAKGNPLLRPSYNNNFELGYSFKSKLNLSMYYQNITNSFSQLVTYTDGIKTIDYANMYNEDNVGIDASYYDTFFKFWEVTLAANAYHTKSSTLFLRLWDRSLSTSITA